MEKAFSFRAFLMEQDTADQNKQKVMNVVFDALNKATKNVDWAKKTQEVLQAAGARQGDKNALQTVVNYVERSPHVKKVVSQIQQNTQQQEGVLNFLYNVAYYAAGVPLYYIGKGLLSALNWLISNVTWAIGSTILHVLGISDNDRSYKGAVVGILFFVLAPFVLSGLPGLGIATVSSDVLWGAVAAWFALWGAKFVTHATGADQAGVHYDDRTSGKERLLGKFA